MNESPAFNPDDYPRIYHYSKKNRLISAAIGFGLLIHAIFFFSSASAETDSLLWQLIGYASLSLGPLFIIAPWTSSIILAPEYIEQRICYVIRRRMKRDAIAGWHSFEPKTLPRWLHDSSISLVPNDTYASRFHFLGVEKDELFNVWCKSLPNYDDRRRKALAELPLAEKIIFYAQPDRVFFPLLAIVYFFPLFFIQHLPSMSVPIALGLGFLPALCLFLALLYPARFSFHGKVIPGKPVKADLRDIYLLSGFLAGLWILRNNTDNKITWLPATWDQWFSGPAVIAIYCLLLSGFLLMIIRNKNFNVSGQFLLRLFGTIALILPFSSAGFAAAFNIVLDRSPPLLHRVTVDEKEFREDHGTYNISVKAHADISSHSDPLIPFSVSSVFYREIEIGDILCVYEHKGLFQLGWLKLDHCPGAEKDDLET